MRSSSLLKAAISLGLPLSVAMAQEPTAPAPAPAPSPGSTGPSSPGTTNPGSRPPGRTPSPFPENQQQRQPSISDLEASRPIMLSGKVMLDSGTPPPDPVVIERVCGGHVKPEGYTDSKGRFSFQLGQNSALMADASVGSDPSDFSRSGMDSFGRNNRGISERDLVGCEIRASLAGFRSTVVPLAGRRSLDNPDIGTLVLQRLAKVDGFTFSATTGMAPKDAVKAYDKGRNAVKKKKNEEAELSLRKAVEIYPKYALAWYELGTVLLQQSKVDDARNAFNEAIKADSKFIKPYALLARMAASEQKWADAAENSMALLKLNPYVSSDVYFVSSVAHLNLNKIDLAEEHAREAVRNGERGTNPRAFHLLSIILAQKNDISGAADNLRTYLKLLPDAPNASQAKKQLAELEQALSARGDGGRPSTAQ